ncbi:hydantoinase/oxoprolinase family protein (plasmid) [Arthrobacter sp. D3-18]
MTWRIGVDIGGTFTDFTLIGEDGYMVLWKEESSPFDPVGVIRRGLEALADQMELTVTKLLAQTSLFVHGTTVATNMLIQRNGPEVALLCTEGFRDVLYFRDGFKPNQFDMSVQHFAPLVDRWLRVGVPGRIDKDGNEVNPLDEAAVRDAAAKFRAAGVEAVAVSFLWSVLNPTHEERAAEILREELPGVHVITSNTILPEIREWQRTSSTVLSAYIAPKIRSYLRELESELERLGLRSPLLIMQINGGCARVSEIVKRPVNILASGPAAAPAAARYHSEGAGNNVISVDMGGTSLDVCLIRDGVTTMSRDIQVENQPIGVPAVDTHSVGAGGGSIGWIDNGGALRIGPRSAGAVPGPACYDNGGVEPTVTDANVILGFLDPDRFLGGRRRLRDDLSRKAIDEKIAGPLGLDTVSAAAGMIRVVNSNMVAAIRSVSVQRGLDPRGFSLVSGGGAGGLHAVELARELGISTLFIPLQAGVLCSFGMTVTDVQHDYLMAGHAYSTDDDAAELASALERLELEARNQLMEEGFDEARVQLRRAVDARYPGQVHELTVVVPASERLTPAALKAIATAFNEDHLNEFAYNRPNMPVEFLHWRVAAVGSLGKSVGTTSEPVTTKDSEPVAIRQVYSLVRDEMTEVPVYESVGVGIGSRIEGPAVLYAPTTTIVLAEGDRLTMHGADGYTIDVAAKDDRGRSNQPDRVQISVAS